MTFTMKSLMCFSSGVVWRRDTKGNRNFQVNVHSGPNDPLRKTQFLSENRFFSSSTGNNARLLKKRVNLSNFVTSTGRLAEELKFVLQLRLFQAGTCRCLVIIDQGLIISNTTSKKERWDNI